jgi:penicillin-binding protein 2
MDGAVVAAAGRAPDPYFRPVTPLTPGSVFKLVTAFAALEAGVSPSATFSCEGTGRLANGQKYTCTHVHGTVDLAQAFEESCNGFFMTRAMDAGPRWMADAYARLGMDVMPRLGMGFSPRDGRILDFGSQTAQLGIGQAHALATPLQVATAYARLATRGRRIVPWLDRDVGPDPASRTSDPEIARHAALLLDAAHRVVVGERGTAHGVAGLLALDAAGKTGTAELDSSLANRKRNAWFVGFAPYDAPRYVAVVVRERLPKGAGATLAGPDVARLLEAALRER